MGSGNDTPRIRTGSASEPEPVELSAEESMVLLRGDDPMELLELCAETGMSPGQVHDIRTKLQRMGLVEEGAGVGHGPILEPLLHEMDEAAPDTLRPDAPAPIPADAPTDPMAAAGDEPDYYEPIPIPEETAAERAARTRDSAVDAEEVAGGEEGTPAAEEPAAEEEATEKEVEAAERGVVADYRRLYETQYHPMAPDQRAHVASTTSGPPLLALCFDADPKVIKAVLENPTSGLEHARLIAFNHHNSVGLEALWARRELGRDTTVQRRLLRNTASSENLVRRVLHPKRLLETYKTTLDREVPDRTRATARSLLRTKWATAEPDERVALIWTTEGRVLTVMTGCTFDSKTTLMMCARPVVSVMLVQSLSRFPATPPSVLAHLLKQPMVKRQPHLRAMILQHPNVPSDAKRK